MAYKLMQIEVSNLCSLRCAYCPHPSQVRPKGNMNMRTFKACMELVARSENPHLGARKFVWLNHFGEPLLNPLLPEFVSYAVNRNIEVSFATNGVDHDKQMFPRSVWRSLASAGLKGVMLSAHVKSERKLRDHIGDIVKVLGVWKPQPEYFHDWAGQVDMTKFNPVSLPLPGKPCDYQTDNMFAVTWDGRIAACCYDIEGSASLTVSDVLEHDFTFKPISLCARCRLGRGDVSWLWEPLVQTLGEAEQDKGISAPYDLNLVND